MSRYEFVSPGGMAGQALLETMTRNRAEARQRLLDEVQKKNIESEIASRESQAASAAEERAGMKAWREAQAADLADRKAQRERSRTGTINFIKSQPDLDDKTRQMMQLAAETGDDDLLHTIASRYLTPTKPNQAGEWFPIYTSEGVDTGNFAPKGAHFLPHEPRQPAPPKQSYAAPGLTTEDGRLITVIDGVPYAVNPKTGKNEVYSGKAGGRPASKSANGGAIPFAAFKDVAAKAAKAQDIEHWYGTTKAKPGDVAAYNQSVQNAITTYPTNDQDVRDTAIDIMFNEHKDANGNVINFNQMPVEDIIQNYVPTEDWDPQSVNDLRNILNGLRQR